MINAPMDRTLREEYKSKNRACKAAVKREKRKPLENEITRRKV